MCTAIRNGLISTAAIGAVTLQIAAAASAAAAAEPTAAYPGGVVVASNGGASAIVRVSYSCTSTVSPANHLFVAVKQGPNVTPDNPSSDGTTTAFLSTNWSPDGGPNALDCDGNRHLQQIAVKPQGYGPLVDGRALVQICVYDNITGANVLGEPIGGYAGSYTMQRVVVSHAAAH
jgi:hypothetical protein